MILRNRLSEQWCLQLPVNLTKVLTITPIVTSRQNEYLFPLSLYSLLSSIVGNRGTVYGLQNLSNDD